MENAMIKKWFFEKENADVQIYCHASIVEYAFVGETEKALKVKYTCESNLDVEKKFTRFGWVPKSCCCSLEEYQADCQREKLREEKNFERYNNLLNFAKENGLKVRNKMKAKTILKAIKEAGLSYNY